MDWCRLWNETADDPKWRLIARKVGCRTGDVLSVFMRMMTCASAARKRGFLEGWDDEVQASALDFEPELVAAIRDAMQGRVLDGDRLTGWEKRQPKREREDDSADRVRRHRQQPKGGGNANDDDVTPRNANDSHETPPEEIREEKKEESPPTPSEGESVSDDEPKDKIAHHFQTWWQQFPRYRRGARGPTEKKYRSLCKRRRVTPAELQSGLDRYLQAGYGSSKYAKGALAWLNGELWTVDEFPPAGDATGPPKPTIELTPDEQTVHRAMMHVTMKGRSDEYYKLVELRESGRMVEALEMAREILPEMQA